MSPIYVAIDTPDLERAKEMAQRRPCVIEPATKEPAQR